MVARFGAVRPGTPLSLFVPSSLPVKAALRRASGRLAISPQALDPHDSSIPVGTKWAHSHPGLPHNTEASHVPVGRSHSEEMSSRGTSDAVSTA